MHGAVNSLWRPKLARRTPRQALGKRELLSLPRVHSESPAKTCRSALFRLVTLKQCEANLPECAVSPRDCEAMRGKQNSSHGGSRISELRIGRSSVMLAPFRAAPLHGHLRRGGDASSGHRRHQRGRVSTSCRQLLVGMVGAAFVPTQSPQHAASSPKVDSMRDALDGASRRWNDAVDRARDRCVYAIKTARGKISARPHPLRFISNLLCPCALWMCSQCCRRSGPTLGSQARHRLVRSPYAPHGRYSRGLTPTSFASRLSSAYRLRRSVRSCALRSFSSRLGADKPALTSAEYALCTCSSAS